MYILEAPSWLWLCLHALTHHKLLSNNCVPGTEATALKKNTQVPLCAEVDVVTQTCPPSNREGARWLDDGGAKLGRSSDSPHPVTSWSWAVRIGRAGWLGCCHGDQCASVCSADNFEVDLDAGTTKGTSILDANYGFFSSSWALYCFAFILAF